MSLTLTINGAAQVIASDPETPLLYVLRNELGLKGSKFGCGLEQCGACAVLVDGEVTLSCNIPAGAFEGREVTTIEGIAARPAGARVQDAFVQASAAQCGYCTAGLVVAVTALLEKLPSPSRSETANALTPHLCRCGCHPRVFEAVDIASA